MAKSSYSASTPFANNGNVQGLEMRQPPKPSVRKQSARPQEPPKSTASILTFTGGTAEPLELHIKNLMTIDPIHLFRQIDRNYDEMEYSRDIKAIIENHGREDFGEEYSRIYANVSFTGDFEFIPYLDVSNLRPALLPPDLLQYAKDVEFNTPYSQELCIKKGRAAENLLEARASYKVPGRDDLLNFSLSNTDVLSNYDRNMLVINGIISGNPVDYIRSNSPYPNSFGDNLSTNVSDYDYADMTDEEIKSGDLTADRFYNILHYTGEDVDIEAKRLELDRYLEKSPDLDDLRQLLGQFVEQKPRIDLSFNNKGVENESTRD